MEFVPGINGCTKIANLPDHRVYTPHITIKIAHAFNPHSCVHAGLSVYIHISASPVFYTPVRVAHFLCVQRAGLFIYTLCLQVSVMKLAFIYCILGYRVYRIGIIILIVSAWLPPDTVTTYGCILTTKNIQNNFQKRLDFCFVFVYTCASSNETHKTFWR